MKDAGSNRRKSRLSRKAVLVVVLAAIVLIITGIVFDVVHINGDRGRAEAEIAAMSTALVSYAASNGLAPSDPLSTDLLQPAGAFDPEEYIAASRILYKALSGDSDGDPTARSPQDTEVFFDFKPRMLRSSPPGPGTYVVDPFGNSYGYSTFKAKNPKSEGGYNRLFDLWSTTGGKTEKDRTRWTKNW